MPYLSLFSWETQLKMCILFCFWSLYVIITISSGRILVDASHIETMLLSKVGS